MAGGVAHRAVAAHRQPGDRAPALRGDRAVRRVDPRDELAHVVGLPPRLVGRSPRYQSVYQPSVPPSGITTMSGDRAVIASASPKRVHEAVVGVRAVQEIEHRVAPGGVRTVAAREQHADVRRLASAGVCSVHSSIRAPIRCRRTAVIALAPAGVAAPVSWPAAAVDMTPGAVAADCVSPPPPQPAASRPPATSASAQRRTRPAGLIGGGLKPPPPRSRRRVRPGPRVPERRLRMARRRARRASARRAAARAARPARRPTGGGR